jgi:exopolysaccharide biosynthesis polyprenyl glycosylphosphotransferase
MYNVKKYPISWRMLLHLGDILGASIAVPLSFWASRYIDVVPTPNASRITTLNCIFAVCLLLYYFQRVDLYRSRCFLHRGPTIRRLILSLTALVITFGVMRELSAPHREFGYLEFIALYAVITFFIVYALRRMILFIDIHFLRSMRVERIACVGWSFRIGKVMEAFTHELLSKQTIVGYILDDNHPELRPPEHLGYKQLGTLNELPEILERFDITSLVVSQRRIPSSTLRDIALTCADKIVALHMIPWSTEIWIDHLMVRVIGGVPLLDIRELRHDNSTNKIMRRGVDIAGAIVGLILSAPVIAILSFLIKRESPGPVFYRQVRLGLHDKPFELIKLRSMRLDAEKEKGAVWTVENDPRRLKIGEFMRKWNLDELPQFWNVLKGEMSLVGPRPERPEFVEKFRDTVHYYNLRHCCKPGLTGWAAVHGLRGNTSLEDRLSYDLFYIEHWSLLLDFKIMLMTLLPPRNAY